MNTNLVSGGRKRVREWRSFRDEDNAATEEDHFGTVTVALEGEGDI